MDKEMKALLQAAAVTGRLPIVRFELRSSKDRELISTALRDVWMTGPDDGMALVKARAARIAEAAQAGLVQVTYHLLVTLRRDYALYEESGLFAQLRQMTEEGAKRPDFLFDIPHIKRGAVVLTDAGRRALAQAECGGEARPPARRRKGSGWPPTGGRC